MTNEKREAAELLLANRLYLYSLLHKTFGRDPDAELLTLLSAETTVNAFALLSEEKGDVLDRVGPFLEGVRAKVNDPAFLEDVKAEYMHLFVGPDKLVAPPWESVYRGEDAMLFQEVTLEVREIYRGFGLLPEGYPHVADDSLALELAFMAKLAERALEDLHNEDEVGLGRLIESSEEFLSRHLLLWIPKFLERMQKARTQFLYPQLCVVLDAFLKRDRDTLQELRDALETA
jgi:TorA maturation chaperone TorD